MAAPDQQRPPSPPAVQDLTGKTVGRFIIRGRLGAGGMGEVYLAEDTKLKRVVALKRMAPQLHSDERFRRRFLSEAERASSLTDPHVAGIYDVFEEGGEIFLVMEYIEGSTVRARLAEPIDIQEILAIAAQCAEALVAAHEKGIVHQDIKPENIMLTPKGQVKICDFGVARRLPAIDQNSPTESVAGQTEALRGTPTYMAPEVLLEKDVDGRADIFSLGVVFYEILTGRHPFVTRGFVATSDRILHVEPTALTQLNPRAPAELERIVAKMLAKEPAQRYATAADLLVDLRAVRERPGGAIRAPVPAVPWLRRRTVRLAVALVAAALVVALTSARLFLRPSPPPFEKRGWVLIADFENRTGEANLDAILKDSLTYELEQSPYLNLFSHSRVQEALSRMKRPATTAVDEQVGREICAREGLKAFLLASVAKLDDRYVVGARVMEPAKGTILASAQETSLSRAEALAGIRRIARRLRGQLGETLSSIQATSPPLEKVTSASFEAVQLFTLGRQRLDQGDPAGALQLFLRSLDRDPDFAMAHEHAAIAYQRLGDYRKLVEHLERAVQLSDHLGPRERHRIQGDYDAYLERFDSAIAHYRVLVDLYPDDFRVHTNLGYFYGEFMQYDAALKEAEVAFRLYPDELARELLALHSFRAGRSAEAVRLEEENLREFRQRIPSSINLATYRLARGEMAAAQAALAQAEKLAASSEPYASQLTMVRVDSHLAQGRFQEALRELAPDGGPPKQPSAVLRRLRRAEIWLEMGQPRKCAEELTGLPDLPERPDLWLRKGLLGARVGRLALAEAMLSLLKKSAVFRQSPVAEARVHQLQAEIDLERGRLGQAAQSAAAAVQAFPSTFVLETLARVQRARGEKREELKTYQTLLKRGAERTLDVDGPAFFRVVLTHYRLGRLLDEMGQEGATRTSLGEFLRWWGKADPQLPQLQDARRRLGQGAQSTPGGRVPTPAA